MAFLVLRSYFELIAIGLALRTVGLKGAYAVVHHSKIKPVSEHCRVPYEHICHAVDFACLLFPKTILCLQRSVATVSLLRSHGWPAEFVTGCSIGTFENHAWVELNGAVVNDKPYMHEIYQVLDRC